MKKLSILALTVCALSLSATAFGSEKTEYANIVTGSSTGSWSTYLGDTPEGSSKDQLAISLGYVRELVHGLGVAAEGNWLSVSSSDHVLELLAGPEYNLFADDTANSPFLTVLAGIENVSASSAAAGVESTSSTHFALKGAIGKRFELFSHVSYSPQVTVTRVFSESTRLAIVPISFSFLF